MKKAGKLRNAPALSIQTSRRDSFALKLSSTKTFLQYGSEAAVKEAGKLGVEGKKNT